MPRTDVCTVDEAEEIEEGDGRNDVEIDLQAESGFGGSVEDHERASISSLPVSDCLAKVEVIGFTCQSRHGHALRPHAHSQRSAHRLAHPCGGRQPSPCQESVA